MSGREFEELVEDVRVNGLREPVVVRGDQLIDGRNRVRACAAAGVVPGSVSWRHGTDVASWVMSVNVRRRHLGASRRALLASRLSTLSGEVTLSQAGEMMGVSRASVAQAAAVENDPEPLRAAARDGVVSVGDAYELRGEEPETHRTGGRGEHRPEPGGSAESSGSRPGRSTLPWKGRASTREPRGLPWGGVWWLTGEGGLDSVVEPVVNCVNKRVAGPPSGPCASRVAPTRSPGRCDASAP